MAGPLNSIFAACESIITPNLAASSIVATYGHTGAERFTESAPPRIVWVPTKEDIGPARGLGGDTSRDSAGNMALPGGALQPLFSRIIDVETDLWGPDRDTVETMINAVVSGVHDTMTQGSYGIVGAQWLLPEETGKDGEIYRLTFQFFVPIVRVAPGTTVATMTSIPVTPSSTFHVGS